MEAWVAWAAGFIDGEGCIYIRRQGQVYCLALKATNTNRPALERLVTIFGCGAIVRTVKARNQRRDCYEWHVYGRAAAAVLRQLKPYLIVKTERTRIALAFQRGIGKRPLTAKHLADRERWRQRMLLAK